MDRRLLGSLVVAMATAISAGAAHAATIVQNGSCSTTATEAPVSETHHVFADRCAVTFDKFDPALGTLSSVRLELISGTSYRHALTGFNPTGLDQAFTLGRQDSEYTLALEGVPTVPAAISLESGTNFGPTLIAAPAGEQTVDLGSLGATTLGDGNHFTYAGAANGFIGLGTFDAAFILSGGFLITLSDPAMSYARSVDMHSEVAVTYSYEPSVTPVPEPRAWALMIAGFGLAGGSLRRRQSAS